jgi:hypothetical protein
MFRGVQTQKGVCSGEGRYMSGYFLFAEIFYLKIMLITYNVGFYLNHI